MRPRRVWLAVAFAASFVLVLAAPALHAARPKPKEAPADAPLADSKPAIDPALFSSLEWREVGPYRGGRSAAVTGVPGQPNLYYFGSTGGGVWKTTDGGLSWKCVSDGFFGGSIGAVAVSEWDPNVIYVGTGEKTVRGNVSSGDGMWKSTDAGKTWKHVGLADSRHIPRVRIHPRNPDLVYAAVLGHLFGPNEERGVYRSQDGGKSWQRVLFANPDAGAVDLAMDPTNPRVLYASTWRVRRTPWSLESGGPGSGLWKSTDGGDTWDELTANPGLPKGTLGIIGITVSPSNPENLYAIVEAEQGGVFRSKDGGKTWEKTNDSRDLRQRAWYYSRIYADPKDQEAVYVLNVRFHRSKDGGKTFSNSRTPHGDNHDLWIAPEDPLRMIESNDGGANVSTDGGKTWTPQSNQPTSQIYRVSTDNAFPYRLLGGQQDNSALRIRSRSLDGGGIGARDWDVTAGGESGHVVAKPDQPDVVYGGSYGGFLERLDHSTGQSRLLNVWPDDPMGWGAAELKYRFQWNYPIFFSPHDANTLYAAGNVLFRSRDGGETWEAVSGDLTRNDKSKLGPSGGPITKDNTSVEYYCTIFAALESPHEAGVLWAGSDDGLVHVSRDGGKSWQNVTPPGLPEWSMVNSLEADPFAKSGLYLAATRYKLDDDAPYLFKTTDYGATWQRIDGGIDRTHATRVVRADPGRRGLLYAGTERGAYLSFDAGGHWQSLQLNLPKVPVTDLAVKNGDLVAATQGRGFWVLDDLSVLHQLEPELAAQPAHLYLPRPADRAPAFLIEELRGMGKNPYPGVVLHYYLEEELAKQPAKKEGEGQKSEGQEGKAKEAGAEKAEAPAFKLEILDQRGEVIQTFTRKPDPGEEEKEESGSWGYFEEPETKLLTAKQGGNRVAWDLLLPPAERFPGLVLWNDALEGPRVGAGKYQARLTVGEWNSTVPFEVVPDPRSTSTPAERQAQLDFARGVRDKLSEVHGEIRRVREVRGQIEGLEKRLGKDEKAKPVVEAGEALKKKLTAIEEVLYQTKNKSAQDPLNYPVRLNDKLAGLLAMSAVGDGAPTASMVAVRGELTAAIDAELAKLAAIWKDDLPAFNRLAREAEVPVLALPPEKAPEKK